MTRVLDLNSEKAKNFPPIEQQKLRKKTTELQFDQMQKEKRRGKGVRQQSLQVFHYPVLLMSEKGDENKSGIVWRTSGTTGEVESNERPPRCKGSQFFAVKIDSTYEIIYQTG
ncbi:unnamed protein product, partial [Mesorhabditis belari]|uniref:Uncharacterized protein n=1 Tax=Mesorhabditis belari TaxID=2138241 RepID=A0AAF3F9A1_9BILA